MSSDHLAKEENHTYSPLKNTVFLFISFLQEWQRYSAFTSIDRKIPCCIVVMADAWMQALGWRDSMLRILLLQHVVSDAASLTKVFPAPPTDSTGSE